MNISTLIHKAKTSAFYRWILNRVLCYAVPFNSPHKFKITQIDKGNVMICLPYIRKNKNHINGIHACALATVSEYATGLCLTTMLPANEYRIILKSIHMDYHYQGKTDILCGFSITDAFLSQHIINPLQTEEAVFVKLKVDGYDTKQKLISSGIIEWQVKKWEKVKTKI